MTIYAINGSPRKTNNTATLLSEALAGAQAALPGVETELIHLYSYNQRLRKLFRMQTPRREELRPLRPAG